MRRGGGAALCALAAALCAQPAWAGGPQPGTPEYVQRDNQNMADAYGRQTAPDGQLSPQYVAALPAKANAELLDQVADQAAHPTRPVLDPGQWVPGWNAGNPYRQGWEGVRGRRTRVAFTNRYGARLRGDVYEPLPGARDPYSGRRLRAPYPGVVITTGSVQGSQKMYEWLAQDLAERGYVVLTYDVQGQGTSETLPHQGGPADDFPWCDPSAAPLPGEQSGCPGVPFQQAANFVNGTLDALDFFLSTPRAPYRNRAAGSARVNGFNPLWRLIDRRRDRRGVTPGRTTKVAIVGHSLGAAAVSHVQGVDRRVATVVALDKLSAGHDETFGLDSEPVVPALAVQSEYGFNVTPYWGMGSIVGIAPSPPDRGPDPRREQRTGFDGWRAAGVDTMLVVPRASTHLEYTDIAYALPASRYGQAFSSHYVQAWLDKYLKHDATADRRLLEEGFTYLEPAAGGEWVPVALDRAQRLSFYFCSGHRFHTAGGRLVENVDVAGVGGC